MGNKRGSVGSSLLETEQGSPARHESWLTKWKVHAMKKFAAFALLLMSLGVFAVGCEKPKEGAAPAEGGAPATGTPAPEGEKPAE